MEAARAGDADPFDDSELDDEDLLDQFEIPSDMPPEVARMLFEETRNAVRRGESLDQFLSRLTGSGLPRKRRKKGRRR